MKNILDIYLKQHKVSKDELLRAANLAPSSLKQTKNSRPEKWDAELIQSIAKLVMQAPQNVVNNLIRIADNDELFEVDTVEELKQLVHQKEDEFIVMPALRDLMREIKKSQLTESEEMGFQLGSQGSGGILSSGIHRLFNQLESNPEQENLKQDISSLYQIESRSDATVKLRLKQLDY